MTRSARRRRDRVTVDELLRQSGVQPRKVGSRSSPSERAARNAVAGLPSERRAPEPRAAGVPLERRAAESRAAGVPSERRAPEPRAAGVPLERRAVEPRAGAARFALASGVLAVLGGLVLVLALRPEPVPATTQFPQLQPATGAPTSSIVQAAPTETTTPSPVVMHARKTPTPTPTVTVKVPPPVTTTPSKTPPTWDPRWNYYQCYPYYCGYRR
ncbi:hypothetical protein ABJI51_02250 [Amycolatopsis sp. NEAU-NG30]|uniref:Uncharacterized protein n=1 Tax=Amycolatopsis melonis TaxID=3156488 RepID=A0ABV0L6F4_9PSEU